MVRGPAAVLGALAAGQAYVAVAPSLPALGDRDAALLVPGAVGLAVALLWAGAAAALVRETFALVLALAGLPVVVAALEVADVGAAAMPLEAAAGGVAGAAFARALPVPALALALPFFIAAIDAVAAAGGGGSGLLHAVGVGAPPGDPLTLEAPRWGGGGPAAVLGFAATAFLGAFVAYAHRFALRPWSTAALAWALLAAALALQVLDGTALPVLPLVCAAYLLANADRLRTLFRRSGEG